MEEPSFMNVDSDSPSSVLKMLTVSRCNGIRGMRGVLTGRDVDRRKCATCGRMEESVRSYAGSWRRNTPNVTRLWRLKRTESAPIT